MCHNFIGTKIYVFTVKIKQSDVVLLGYPLMMPMTKQLRRNDLEKYEDVSINSLHLKCFC